jgi:hypothetical protein
MATTRHVVGQGKKHKTPIKSLTLVGRRWFNRGPGNTYHSVEIIVNGKPVHKIPFAYGYGEQYEQSAFDWLEANGYLDRERSEPPWQVAKRLGFDMTRSVSDVSRKKDL